MKTKLLSLLLMLVMLASLAACGGPDQAGQEGAEGSPKEESCKRAVKPWSLSQGGHIDRDCDDG